MAIADIEKLGVFYLGRLWDAATKRALPDPLLYDSRDLTTHAVCLGMTGSGKTGLCVSLLEEAALDGIPAIAIDPKGDLGNLLLTFPALRSEDFLPWIDPGEAERAGADVATLAARTAERWRQGLADSGQDGARIARLRAAADVVLYTPGSSAGRPISALRSLSAPAPALAADPEALRDRLLGAVAALLSLLGIDADPVRSRESILLAKIVETAWAAERDIEIADLVRAVHTPPFERVGALDLEAFYPARERAALALALNNLVASPGFAAWREGEALDVARLLWSPEGKPRIAIVSIAHLSDAERMFFVSLLLGEVVAWMRAQSGTSSLRAILYMDEVAGYLPPVASPPSKPPMLLLLKQARAFGLGVVLATQNPVDLDYKALSNAGTWLIGRLQTERDKARVLEGLEGAAAASGHGIDRAAVDAILSGLGNRVFLMNDVHEDAPVLFQTRWTLSYLRGPLTRAQIHTLTRTGDGSASGAGPEPGAPASPTARPASPPPVAREAPPSAVGGAASTPPSGPRDERPLLDHGVSEAFAAIARPGPAGARLLYRPAVLGRARLHYAQASADIDTWEEIRTAAPLAGVPAAPDWDAAVSLGALDTAPASPAGGVAWADLPSAATRPKSYAPWGKSLAAWLQRTRALELRRCAALGLVSRPGESDAEFRVRVAHAARERVDAEKEKLLARFSPRLTRIADQERRADQRVAREGTQYAQSRADTLVSVGTTVLGAIFGRRVASASNVGRAGSAARSLGRAARERADIALATEELEAVRAKRRALEEDLAGEEARIASSWSPDALAIETLRVRPRKGDLAVEPVSLVWLPFWVASDGADSPAHA